MPNRGIEWDRNGLTIEADQRHVGEIMKGLELERTTLRLHVLTWRKRNYLCDDPSRTSTNWMAVLQRATVNPAGSVSIFNFAVVKLLNGKRVGAHGSPHHLRNGGVSFPCRKSTLCRQNTQSRYTLV